MLPTEPFDIKISVGTVLAFVCCPMFFHVSSGQDAFGAAGLVEKVKP